MTQYKKGKDSLAAQGKRRYDRMFAFILILAFLRYRCRRVQVLVEDGGRTIYVKIPEGELDRRGPE